MLSYVDSDLPCYKKNCNEPQMTGHLPNWRKSFSFFNIMREWAWLESPSTLGRERANDLNEKGYTSPRRHAVGREAKHQAIIIMGHNNTKVYK
jgi:hypothetical protein